MPAWRRSPKPLSTTEPDRLLLSDLTGAVMLLTRLPVGRLGRFGGPPDLARCLWAFPVVGLVVGGVGGAVYALAHWFSMPPLLATAWSLGMMMIVTGALHEDGLADTADGFGGGATPARKMEIMRDCRIGSYGTLALVLSVIVRAAAIAALRQPVVVATAMILAGMLGRGAILLLLLVLPPARADGMGAAMGKPNVKSAAVGFGLAIGASFLFLPIGPAIAVVVLGLAAASALARLAAVQIEGYTGDVLGAAEVITECVALTMLACLFQR